jgi:hypothetical protein
MMWKTVMMLAISAGASIATVGCCGVAPASDYDKMNKDGAVQFDPTAVGASEVLTIPIKDTANVDETITAASLEGPGAGSFEVVSTFPIPVPAGTAVNVQVRFTPSAAGDTTATLVLQTEGMGPSPVDLDGTGT